MQQNEDAFTTFYYRYYDLMCRKAYRRIPEEAIVEEIVQDVFLTFWNKAATLDAGGNISAWLYATLRNKVLHHLRTEQTRQVYIRKLEQLQKDVSIDAQDKLALKQTEEEIHTIIQALPAQCREAFVLSRYENLSYREIAERMDISVNTVEKHIGKALTILRKGLRDHPVELWLLFLAGFELAEKFIK
ncbi:MAG: RNA polymerase sigma-70 factor [Bacteroidetes bacterium]|nr:RNA polymerase sigma-70 factor [Bacteroidota bacterium]